MELLQEGRETGSAAKTLLKTPKIILKFQIFFTGKIPGDTNQINLFYFFKIAHRIDGFAEKRSAKVILMQVSHR